MPSRYLQGISFLTTSVLLIEELIRRGHLHHFCDFLDLGYAGTDKPTDPREYRMKLMTQDIVEILDAERAARVISLAHDW